MNYIKKIMITILIIVLLCKLIIPTLALNDDNKIYIDFNEASGIFTINSESDTEALIIVSLYKEGVLGNIYPISKTITSSGTKLELSTINTEGSDTLKICIWNNTNDIEPLSDSYTLNLNKLDILTVQNGHLTNKNGNKIVLKGVNLGGWLLQETWMCPLISITDDVLIKNGEENGWANLDTLDYFETNFGTEETSKLIKEYQDNYITEWDFENVKNLGFNCVRIPFWYRNFMSDESGTYYTTDDNENPGFQKLDWAIETAGKYGLYVVLDMHGAPGGQSGDHSTGKVGRNYLYKETKYQDIMEDLWRKIAGRYKFSKNIASYDIMNEPLNNADTAHNVESQYVGDPWVGNASDPRIPVYDRMIKAIREEDSQHNITVEGIWRIDRLPNPNTYGWTNVMYQLHSYDSDYSTTNTLINSLVNVRNNWGVAAYMGEFNPAVYYNGIADLMQSKDINYTLWNYKVSVITTDNSYVDELGKWGLYYKNYAFDLLNGISKASVDWNGVCYYFRTTSTVNQIKNTYTSWWTNNNLRTDNNNFKFNQALYDLIK